MIIPFLKALYHLEDCWLHEETEYSALLEEIELHALGSQIYSLLKGSGRILDVPHFFRERLSRTYEACFYQNMLIKHETELLMRKLEAGGLSVIPLKGAVMAERFFGHFAARGTSDIDLLVKPEHLEEAVRIVREAGYSRPAADSPVHYHTEWMKEAPGLPEPLVVELHWSFVPQGSSAVSMIAAWEESIPLAGHSLARGLSAEYTFYTLCLHGASHHMDSFKHVLDLVHLLCEHGDHIDLAKVIERAVKDRTFNRVRAALSITYSLIPELHRLKPLPFQPKLPVGSSAGELSKLNKLMFNLSLLDSWSYKVTHLQRILFPSRELARYSVEAGSSAASGPRLYFQLYRQRLRRLLGG